MTSSIARSGSDRSGGRTINSRVAVLKPTLERGHCSRG
eukprot:XP_001708285.1 Hypothetical protein GL50803_23145 [Giardia lamblia ATCC 50803]